MMGQECIQKEGEKEAELSVQSEVFWWVGLSQEQLNPMALVPTLYLLCSLYYYRKSVVVYPTRDGI